VLVYFGTVENKKYKNLKRERKLQIIQQQDAFYTCVS